VPSTCLCPIENYVRCLLLRFDSGWLFLIAGAVLLWAAIVLPAKKELAGLQQRLILIQNEHEHIEHQINQYQSFFDSLARHDPALLARVIKMQTSGYMSGEFVVFDPNAAKTPLQWLERRTAREPEVINSPEQPSKLEALVTDDQRLWVAGFGGLVIFIGLVQGPRRDH
jgi:hypothetical protein